MLSAVVSKFPEPVLDGYAGALLLPLVARLSAEPAEAARAAVGAVIRQLATRVGARVAREMAAMLPPWFAPEQAAGVRQCAAQLTGILATARPDALADVLPRVLACAAAECRRADAEHRALEAELQRRSDAADSEALGVAGSEDAEAGALRLAEAAIARCNDISTGRATDEEPRRRGSLRSAPPAAGLTAAADAAEPGSDDDADAGTAPAAAAHPHMPVGSSGGGADVFSLARATGGASAPGSGAAAGAGEPAQALPLVWESLYHTLVALEWLWASGAEQVEAALVEAQCDEALPEAVFQLLLYPHAWVRLPRRGGWTSSWNAAPPRQRQPPLGRQRQHWRRPPPLPASP